MVFSNGDDGYSSVEEWRIIKEYQRKGHHRGKSKRQEARTSYGLSLANQHLSAQSIKITVRVAPPTIVIRTVTSSGKMVQIFAIKSVLKLDGDTLQRPILSPLNTPQLQRQLNTLSQLKLELSWLPKR